MSERTRNGKTFAQDATGFLFCLGGGFFAVSIVLFLMGQEPKEGLVSALTWPVVELVARLGSPAALLFSTGLAVLGTVLFLRPSSLPPLRPLTALLFGSLGVALITGGFGGGGELGAWLPALVTGFIGRALAVVLGAALGWFGWSFLFSAYFLGRQPRKSSADVVQRIGLAARHDAAAGVSPAEAALLVTEPRASAVRPIPQRPAALREEPVRAETIRPFPPGHASSGAPRGQRAEGQPASARAESSPVTPSAVTPSGPFRPSSSSEASVSVLTPPAPSWEEQAAPPVEREEEPLQATPAETAALAPPALLDRLASDDAGDREEETEDEEPVRALAGVFEAEETMEEITEEIEEELTPELSQESSAPTTPTASWEQVGLFDEEDEDDVEEGEEELGQPKRVKTELTPSFDFDAGEPRRPAHEPDEDIDPFAALPSSPEVVPESPREPVEARAEPPAIPAPRGDFTLIPVAVPAPKPAPAGARDEDENWNQLVFEAGCVILEQKRVAVSMLERRFAIDFDQACRVLDELQQAGLIGPYMGGRTRDILLTREEWLPHAPHAT